MIEDQFGYTPVAENPLDHFTKLVFPAAEIDVIFQLEDIVNDTTVVGKAIADQTVRHCNSFLIIRILIAL